MIAAVNKPLKFEGVCQLSSVYNLFPFAKKGLSLCAFLIALLVQKLKTDKDFYFCLLNMSRSYLHSFVQTPQAQLLYHPDFSTKKQELSKVSLTVSFPLSSEMIGFFKQFRTLTTLQDNSLVFP